MRNYIFSFTDRKHGTINGNLEFTLIVFCQSIPCEVDTYKYTNNLAQYCVKRVYNPPETSTIGFKRETHTLANQIDNI